MGMPLGRYFAVTGSLLLALLFLADWYIPKVAPATVADIDRTIIRIHSAHKWPEAINIDTSLPTIVPPPMTVVADTAARPAPHQADSRRAALALATDTPPAQAVISAAAAKPVHRRRAKVARAASGRVASSDTFGFRNAFSAGW
jgi:hypothetical protein